MNKALYINTPRVYVDKTLNNDSKIILDKEQSHYLIKVMRRTKGDMIRLFNGKSGEWCAEILNESKSDCEVVCTKKIRSAQQEKAVHVIFSPVRKNRVEDFIVKGVELGATEFHPVITEHTQVHNLNIKRLNKLIIEAAEQSERIILPIIHPLIALDELLTNWVQTNRLIACIERQDNIPALSSNQLSALDEIAFIVGPEGGFSDREKEQMLSNDRILPVSIGEDILRVETAIIFMLSCIKFMKL